MFINRQINTPENIQKWKDAVPFSHLVFDNFLDNDLIEAIDQEFPHPDADFWFEYSNKIEVKKACCDWNKLPANIYKTISYLLSPEFTNQLSDLCGVQLYPDYGLHGGGMHCHKSGGKLNTHLDYTIHPKLGLMRKINIIIYVEKDWDTSWGGSLSLWSHDEKTNRPKEVIQTIDCVFNRAVIFDTTQKSWHGLPEAIKCPDNFSRNSLAVYYTCDPVDNPDFRKKALFAPSEEQKGDPEIEELIAKRSDINTANDVYRK